MTTITTEHFMLPSADPALEIYLRNKRPDGQTVFPPERIVLFVHGASYPGESGFDVDLPGGSWMDFVAGRGFDAWLVDIRGYGRSGRPLSMSRPAAENPPFATTDEAVSDVAVAMDFILERRGAGRLDLVGWSWGTAIAATCAARDPARVERLVLYAPLGPMRSAAPIAGTGSYRSIDKASAWARSTAGIPPGRVEEIRPAAWFDRWWNTTLASDPEGARQDPPVVRAPNGVIADLARFWAQGRSTYDPADIRAPTLLILGEWDRDTPPYMAEELFAGLTGAAKKRLVVLGEGTHGMALEKNRMELIRQVQGFLEE